MNRRMTKWGSLLLINGILLLGIINSINSQDRSLVSLGPQTVRDIDGNVYHTITIGKQVWMLENLKTTRYNDSTSIPLTREDKDWNKLSIPGFCWYNNDPAFKSEYGALYNYYSVNTGKLAPKGWHVAIWDSGKRQLMISPGRSKLIRNIRMHTPIVVMHIVNLDILKRQVLIFPVRSP